MQEIKTQGFKAFMETVDSPALKEKTVICYFSGDKDENGNSWCPDCVASEPIVRKCMEQVKESDNIVFIYCAVGSREYWKDRNNEFRTNKSLKLTGVPTLLKWGTPQKLVENQLREDLISIMFEDS